MNTSTVLLLGAAVGGAALLELATSKQASKPSASAPTVVTPTAGAGVRAARGALPSTVCGVSWLPQNGSDAAQFDPVNLLDAMRSALVDANGADPNSASLWAASNMFFGTNGSTTLPLLGADCLRGLCDAWLGALRAAMTASPDDLALASCAVPASASTEYLNAATEGRAPTGLILMSFGGCSTPRADAWDDEPANWTGLTSLGKAAVALASWRKSLGTFGSGVDTSKTLETWQLLVALAGEMSGVDMVPDGYRPSDPSSTYDTSVKGISGGIGAALGAVSADVAKAGAWVAKEAGSIGGAAAGGFVSGLVQSTAGIHSAVGDANFFDFFEIEQAFAVEQRMQGHHP